LARQEVFVQPAAILSSIFWPTEFNFISRYYFQTRDFKGSGVGSGGGASIELNKMTSSHMADWDLSSALISGLPEKF
jgi:hypothetical protein